LYLDAGAFFVTLPAQSAGPHYFELVRGGAVSSAFDVACADVAVSPELVLRGPPEEPPASPQAVLLSKKG
jgi:hypothetical protein